MKRNKFKIKVGDSVKVLLGKDKGREGNIERIYPKKKMVIVAGVNLSKKHVKGNQSGLKAGIYDIPKPLFVSKVAVICPNCHRATKIKTVLEKKEINRYCKKCNKRLVKG